MPKRAMDLQGSWIENADWFYGGVGFRTGNSESCVCWNARPTVDLLERSFLPEINHISVKLGNLKIQFH